MSRSRDRYALNCKCGAKGIVEVSEDHSMYGRGPIDPWVSHLEGPFEKAEPDTWDEFRCKSCGEVVKWRDQDRLPSR